MEGQWRPHADPIDPMSTNATDDTDGTVEETAQEDRYADLNIGDEEFVIYDKENHRAWLQSTVAVPVEEQR
jgi:hypothetical protein